MRRSLLRLGLMAILISLSPLSQAQLNVVTTTGMIADLTKNIGGQHLKVTALMGTGVDPHLYKATQGDLRRLLRADVILYNGLHLEGKMQDIFKKMARNKTVIAVAEHLPQSDLITGKNYADPHVWFDLRLWQAVGKRITEILIEKDPKNRSDYLARSKAYLQELEALHEWTLQQMATIPQNQRVLITAHDAFGYFGQAYGVQVMGLQGISTAAEFGLQDIKRLKEIIVKHRVRAVFVESSVSPRFIESLVAGVKAEGHEIRIGGELYSDTMGPKGSKADHFIGMVKHNVNTLVQALR